MAAFYHFGGQDRTGRKVSDLPLPNCSKLRSNDIDQIRAHMAEMVCPHDLTIEGGNPTIAFRHNQATLGSLNFDATDYGHPFGNVVRSEEHTSELQSLMRISYAVLCLKKTKTIT